MCVPLNALAQEARRAGTKVIQVGEGADELFAGYTGYAFFADFHRRLWRPYRLLPGAVRQAAWRGLAPALTLDKADVLVGQQRAIRECDRERDLPIVVVRDRHVRDVGCVPAVPGGVGERLRVGRQHVRSLPVLKR